MLAVTLLNASISNKLSVNTVRRSMKPVGNAGMRLAVPLKPNERGDINVEQMLRRMWSNADM